MKRVGFAAGLCIAACAFFIPSTAEAQQMAQLWLEVGAKLDLTRDLRLSLEQSFRADENISRVEVLTTALALRYEISRWLRVGGGYRLEIDHVGQREFRRRHRLNVDLATRHRLGPINLRGRLRYQPKFFEPGDGIELARHTLRFRLLGQLRRVFSKPYISTEIFLRVGEPDVSVAMARVRSTLGVELEIGPGSLNVAYRIEGALLERSISHIVILGWFFDFVSP